MKAINLAVLFVGSASAIIESIDPSCGFIDALLINSAITDAITVATDAGTQLSTFTPFAASLDDPRVAIYDPLFNPGDLQTIIVYLNSIKNIKTIGYKVKFYCQGSSGRIEWTTDPDTNQPAWFDTDFYHNAQPDQKRSIRVGSIPNAKPLGSWTKHGWTVNNNFDSSNQAHIQLAQKTIDGTRLQTDNRDFADVRSGGLLTGTNFNVLDYIRPLSRTILHELFHVVGGLDANNKPIVIDVPNPNASPPRNYGTFNECMSQKNAPVSTVRQAECLTMLAAGLYLDQIQGKPAFWSVGVVDPTTLQPVSLPAAGSAAVQARAIEPFRVRGSY
ncbi:hypothetical protein BGZ57DRAFT_1006181 [Hyaloscypha finlandica]|nr:hypothetical protein BGZ57DRAFT_1006181 [Hyaloscypha finlandica]